MGKTIKYILPWVVAFIVGIYTSFVAMCMWNWFAVQALNAPSVSFLQMLGLIWLINILFNQHDNQEGRWKILFTSIELCVPQEKQGLLSDAMNEIKENFWIDLWGKIAGQFIGNTLTLVLGFILHSFIG